jgi:hypothetical protein
VAQRLRTMPGSLQRRLRAAGRWLRDALGLLSKGLQRLVWYIDDLNAVVLERRWLLLGIAVVILVSVLVGLRWQFVSITLPVLSPPAEMTPTGMIPTQIASTALATAIPIQIGHAQVIGTGKDGLIVRDAPAGKRIGKLANGVMVVVLAGRQTNAGPENPVWWKVQHGDVVGWVSARFLHLLDAP